jgi:hypothetical protein
LDALKAARNRFFHSPDPSEWQSSQRLTQPKDLPPKGFSSKKPARFVASRSQTHEGYFSSSRLAIQLFARIQHPSEFLARLQVFLAAAFNPRLK